MTAETPTSPRAERFTRGREIRLARRPHGHPRASDFTLAEVPIARPAQGEVLVRNQWMSIDPSTRIRMDAGESDYLPPFVLGAPLESWAVGEVVQSRAEDFAPGDSVLHPLGWRDYALLRVGGPGRSAPTLIEVGDETPPRAYLGPLSWVGLTSYVGLLNVAELRADDVVFISGAAGAVGGLAVQIAKLRGHVVIGSAGSDEKLVYLRATRPRDHVQLLAGPDRRSVARRRARRYRRLLRQRRR